MKRGRGGVLKLPSGVFAKSSPRSGSSAVTIFPIRQQNGCGKPSYIEQDSEWVQATCRGGFALHFLKPWQPILRLPTPFLSRVWPLFLEGGAIPGGHLRFLATLHGRRHQHRMPLHRSVGAGRWSEEFAFSEKIYLHAILIVGAMWPGLAMQGLFHIWCSYDCSVFSS